MVIKILKMNNYKKFSILLAYLFFTSCKMLAPVEKVNKAAVPESYLVSKDSTNSTKVNWKSFFADKNLSNLIEIALKNNFELQSTLQNIEIARNDVRMRKGLLFPSVTAFAGAGIEKVGLFTSQGAGDASAEITPGEKVPENLGDLALGLHASWEVDIWKKLRNSKKAAFTRYLATIEGKNFVTTNLVAEVANSYYELLSLDNQLDIINETIALQQNALEIVKVQKEAAKVSELAVKKFEAEVLNSQSLEFDVLQQIKESENRINFLLARFPQSITRDKLVFLKQAPMMVKVGIPSQLLANRPDIKAAELELYATKCDVKVAQAEFYPSFTISGGLGFRAFKPEYFTAPESLFFNFLGDLAIPLINRSAIKAEFNKATAYQIKALYEYQKSVLNGYIEVSNQLSNSDNLAKLYDVKNKEVTALSNAILISNDLFRSARVDYFEVLMTQRDAIASKLELIETKKRQFNSVIDLYKALGGGWQ